MVGLVWLYFADNGTTAEEEVTIRQALILLPTAGNVLFLYLC